MDAEQFFTQLPKDDLKFSQNYPAFPVQKPPLQEERNWIFDILNRVNEAASENSLAAISEKILDILLEVSLAESAIYFSLDQKTDELVIEVSRGDPESERLVHMRIKRWEILSQTNLATPIIVAGDLPSDPRWIRIVDPLFSAHLRNLISLPLVAHGRLVGQVMIFNYQRLEMDLLLVLANRLASESEHWKRLEETQTSNQRLQALIEAMGKVTGTPDRGQLLNLVMQKASQLVNAERVSLFLVDQNTRETMFNISYQAAVESETQPKPDSKIDRSRTNTRVQGEFNYLTRSAVTVPITNGPVEDGSNVTSPILGGLMALNKRTGDFQEDDAWLLSILARQASTFLQVVELYESTEDLFLDAIKSLVAAIDAKDTYTQGHSQRVSDYSVLIAQVIGLSEPQVYDVRIGSLLHDVGKIGIPDAILKKPGTLSIEEMSVMKSHPLLGLSILNKVRLLESMLPGIVQHHERLDGSGYPYGLRGDQISVIGRVIGVADVFDAMTSDRPYRPALKVFEVMNYLKQNRNLLFDTACVNAMENIIGSSEFEFKQR